MLTGGDNVGHSRRAGSVGLRLGAAIVAILGIVPLAGAPAAATSGSLHPDRLAEVRRSATAAALAVADADAQLGALDRSLSSALHHAERLRPAAAQLEEEVGRAAVARFVVDGAVPAGASGAGPTAELRSRRLGQIATEGAFDVVERFAAVGAALSEAEARLADQRAEHRRAEVRVAAARERLQEELAILEQLEGEQAEVLEQRRLAAEEQRQVEMARRAARDEQRRRDEAGIAPGASGVVLASASAGLAVCPVAGLHTFIDSWGFRRSGGRRHRGVDIMAATGVPVVAPVAGVVTHRSNRVGGRSFHLEGVDGARYYGTHLSGYGASGPVEAGDVIGYVGDDGNARGLPHLHFEIHPGGGGAVNPYPFVAAVCSGST